MLLEVKSTYRVDDEVAAKDMIEKYRAEAEEKGYTVKKAGYVRKDKKKKGEVIAVAFVVEIIQVFGDLWEDLI